MAEGRVARPRGAGRGAQRRRQGRVHRRRAAGRGGAGAACTRRKNNWEQATMTALRRESSQRVVPALPALRHLRRLQDAAPARRRAGRDQAARARRRAVAPRQGQARAGAAADRGAGLGLPLPRAPVGALRREEGHGAGRLPRAPVELRGRHGQLRGAAAAPERAAGAAARADRRDGPARPAAADRGGGRRRGDGAGAAPPRAAERRPTCDRLRAFAAAHGVQWWLQPKGPDTVHRLDDGGPSWPTRCPSSASRCRSGRPTSRRSTTHINRVLVARALRLLERAAPTSA